MELNIQQDTLLIYGHKPNLTAGTRAVNMPSSWRAMRVTAHLKEEGALTLF